MTNTRLKNKEFLLNDEGTSSEKTNAPVNGTENKSSYALDRSTTMQHSPRIFLVTLFMIILCGAVTQAQGVNPSLGGAAGDTLGQEKGWTDISPVWLQNTSPMQISFQPGSPDRILLGTVTEGLLDSGDHGNTWSREYNDFFIDNTIPSFWITDVIFNPSNAQEGLAVTMSGSYYSTNGGASWQRHSGYTMPTSSKMVVNSPDGSYAFATEFFGSLFRYDWSTMTWDTELVIHYGSGLFNLSFDQSVPAKLYMGSGLHYIYVSPDMGQSAYSYGGGLPGPALPVLADPEIPDRVLAASGPDIYVKPEAKSRKPVWFLYGTGLPGTTIHAIIHHPSNADVMFAGVQDEGVYYSLDRGATWQALNDTGLDHLTVIDLAINPERPGWLLAAAHSGDPSSGGLYKIKILRQK